ncbi:hypothetical protein [Azospirillum picis]|uniref:Uncharacterized protein n=1 Tax=Azospirillum picis TaxID=488438 RepID=A0ABU0MV09_9PROT|nr:hypothetical protein [Azospirillum picis]MBP2300914.1 hypothetical protein [Azospirillum picis]MDQ0537018.1 hypothetical protein [Azospirillum picis]
MIRTLALLLLCALPACAGHPPLAEASGPLRPLNPGHWTPSEADLRATAAEAGR